MITNFDDITPITDTRPRITGTIKDGNYMLSTDQTDLQQLLDTNFPTFDKIGSRLMAVLSENEYELKKISRTENQGTERSLYLEGNLYALDHVKELFSSGKEIRVVLFILEGYKTADSNIYRLINDDDNFILGLKDGCAKLSELIKQVILDYLQDEMLSRHLLPIRR